MASIVDRVNKLLALAGSSNMHEARNAALLAAKLIRDHGLEVREPTRRATPQRREAPDQAKPRRPSSKKNARVPPIPIIESPLGGDCVVCGRRYRAGAEVHWSDAEGGIHTSCIDEWRRRARG